MNIKWQSRRHLKRKLFCKLCLESQSAQISLLCLRHKNRGKLSDLVAEHLDHLHYLNDILIINCEFLNDVLTDHLLNRLFLPLYVFSLVSQETVSGLRIAGHIGRNQLLWRQVTFTERCCCFFLAWRAKDQPTGVPLLAVTSRQRITQHWTKNALVDDEMNASHGIFSLLSRIQKLIIVSSQRTPLQFLSDLLQILCCHCHSFWRTPDCPPVPDIFYCCLIKWQKYLDNTNKNTMMRVMMVNSFLIASTHTMFWWVDSVFFCRCFWSSTINPSSTPWPMSFSTETCPSSSHRQAFTTHKRTQ